MPNYKNVQLIAYGVVTSAPTQILPDTAAPNSYTADARARATRLCDVADWVRTNNTAALSDPSTLKVFVAPEFYFRYGGPSDPPNTLEDSYPNGELLLPNVNEEILKPRFGKKEYNDWLIIPGTMFWHKSAQDSGTTHPTYFNTVLALHGGTDTALTPEERNANADPMTVPTMGPSSTNQKALMSRIDYALNIDNRQWDAAINPMFQPILGDWEWWRWHTFKVHGVNGPTGHPLVFGLEVCLEHVKAYAGQVPQFGILRALRTSFPTWPEIDVHLVTSCGMSLQPAYGVEAQIGGYAIICDGMQPRSSKASWPTAAHDLVVDIDPTDQSHDTQAASTVQSVANVPANLQIGTHNPADAVAIWKPTLL
ncbi:MAG TPA: hypothetical protein VFV67_33565 [Actinophytocola sp.]|uniref:hypothetical protein n=1 Tax=Actinophytocola sp. TaxID=1872138 RepID=UPI002DBD84B6|nr:hypothetical protein [Actinophytocola sp.]HEU5475597.1 hypothetical protein [Actinophytocola sp.]